MTTLFGGDPREYQGKNTNNRVLFTRNMADVRYVKKHGDRIEGIIDMGSNKITNIGEPTDDTDVVDKYYVDNKTWTLSNLPPEIVTHNALTDREMILKVELESEINEIKTEMKTYVDGKERQLNTALQTYVDGKERQQNTALQTYVDGKERQLNTALQTYVDGKERELKGYVDGKYTELKIKLNAQLQNINARNIKQGRIGKDRLPTDIIDQTILTKSKKELEKFVVYKSLINSYKKNLVFWLSASYPFGLSLNAGDATSYKTIHNNSSYLESFTHGELVYNTVSNSFYLKKPPRVGSPEIFSKFTFKKEWTFILLVKGDYFKLMNIQHDSTISFSKNNAIESLQNSKLGYDFPSTRYAVSNNINMYTIFCRKYVRDTYEMRYFVNEIKNENRMILSKADIRNLGKVNLQNIRMEESNPQIYEFIGFKVGVGDIHIRSMYNYFKQYYLLGGSTTAPGSATT